MDTTVDRLSTHKNKQACVKDNTSDCVCNIMPQIDFYEKALRHRLVSLLGKFKGQRELYLMWEIQQLLSSIESFRRENKDSIERCIAVSNSKNPYEASCTPSPSALYSHLVSYFTYQVKLYESATYPLYELL